MSRLQIIRPDGIQKTMDLLYQDLAHRNAAAPEGNCPVEQTAALVGICLSQSCGKCVPCRIGLDQMAKLMTRILDGEATMNDLHVLERTAQTVMDSADCAIGAEAARSVLVSLKEARADFLAHVTTHHCVAEFQPVPCRRACPAHVDIPGYIALVKEGRFADAINIRGIKRVAVDNAGHVPAPECGPDTGKKIAVIGGGPSGLTAAWFLRLMGHAVTVFEQRKLLGGMLRYGIPRYRLPEQYLNEDIDVILSTGVEVHTDVRIGEDISLEQLLKDFDAVYISIGAHSFRSLGVEGEDAKGILSAVELLRAMGDGQAPDFTGKDIVVVGGGGQPIMDGCELAADRGEILRQLDTNAPIRFSHENPFVQKLYEDYLEKPLSHKAHKLLHTDQREWGIDIK